MRTIKAYTDGGCRGNHQKDIKKRKTAIAYSYLLMDDYRINSARVVDQETNSQAEYKAIELCLLSIIKNASEQDFELGDINIEIYCDAKTEVKQLKGQWQIQRKHAKLRRLKQQILNLTLRFNAVDFFYLPREDEHIEHVDALLNIAMDMEESKWKRKSNYWLWEEKHQAFPE